MAKVLLNPDAWNSVVTTTVQTVFVPEGGDAWFFVGSTSGQDKTNGVRVREGRALIINAGLMVSAYPEPTKYLQDVSVHHIQAVSLL